MRRLLAVVAVLMLSGCGVTKLGSDYRTYHVMPNDGTTSVLIDAKRRAIVSVQNPDPESYVDKEFNKARRAAFVCAEPSPDALATITAAFSGRILGKQLRLSVARTIRETAKQLGTRNTTIQLLRDGLYRQCEAYMNGLIDGRAYRQIANKYINAMVVLLAIEQLTSNPTEEEDGDGQSDQDSTNSAKTLDPANTDEAAPMQSGNVEVGEAVASAVFNMTQAFLDNDMLILCLDILGDLSSQSAAFLEGEEGQYAANLCKSFAAGTLPGEASGTLSAPDDVLRPTEKDRRQIKREGLP